MNLYKKCKNIIVINKNIILASIVFCLIFTICSTTSPLYPFCDESHCFFTVGKALLNGQVLYKDIIEQKGLLIYLLQIPAYLISHKNFLGVWLIQLVLMTISSVYFYKTAYLLSNSSKKSYISTILVALVIFTSNALASGQIVEVYVLPLFIISIYLLLKESKNNESNEKNSLIYLFIIGIIIGIIFWMKYSLLGFYFAYIIVTLIFDIKDKKYSLSIKKVVMISLGFLIITIPCILYFVLNNAFSELINYYIINNVSGYGSAFSLFGTLKSYGATFLTQFKWNPIMTIVLLISLVYIIKTRKISRKVKIILFSSIIMHYMIIFIHGAMFPYYFFAFGAILIFGIVGVVEILNKILCLIAPSRLLENKKNINVMLFIFTITCIILSIIFMPCPRQFLKDPSNLAQYEFAKYMHNKYEEPTSLDYGFLDGGFYTVADIIPNVWAFCGLNWDNPKMYQSQLDAIKNQKTDFVILRALGSDNPIIPAYLEENYNLAMKKSQYRVNTVFTYYLYEKKE